MNVLPDLRFAVKSLLRAPGFTLIAIVTLGLGIGANTSAFSILNEVLLRPLPYADGGRLERIYRATPQDSRGGVSAADYLDLAGQAGGYGEVAAYVYEDMNLSAPGEPAQMANGLRVSANLFSSLGVQPELGRSFSADEGAGNPHALIISHRFWQTRFGGDADIVGRTVRVDGETQEIVGVLPVTLNDWRHLGPYDLFRPLGLTEKEKTDRSSPSLRLLGRRSSTVTRAQGEAFIANFGRRLAAEFPALHAASAWRTLPLDVAVAPDRGPGVLGMLVALSWLVLLIACSNLANLLLARTMARAREFAVRSALGASRLRLLRPLLAESLLLAFAGGIFAIYFATWTNDWIRTVGPGDKSSYVLAIDWRILCWASGACLLTAAVFGVAPALFALRLDVNTTLKSGSRGMTGDRGHQRFRHTLIVGQFALALVLLAAAPLLVRGVHEANNRHYGWDPGHLVGGTIHLPAAAYPGGKQIADFERLAVERLEALPGVASASISYSMPFFGLAEPRKYVVADREIPQPGHEPVAAVNGVTPHYFDTVGTRLLSGRSFDDRDTLRSPKVFIVNEAMAHGLFGHESPLGRRIARAGAKTVELALYRLFQEVDQELAVLMVILGGVLPAALDFVIVLNDAAALILVRGAAFLSVFDKPQRDALAMLFLRMHHQEILGAEIFWGLWLFPLAILVYRSRFLPRFLGVWLTINGFGYLTISLVGLLVPHYEDAVSNIAFPALVGELASFFGS